MKKTMNRHRSMSTRPQTLKLSHETIRTLRAEHLVHAISGCDTSSIPVYTDGVSKRNCAGTNTCV